MNITKIQNLNAPLFSYKMIFTVEIIFKPFLLQNVYTTTLLETNKQTTLKPQDTVPYEAQKLSPGKYKLMPFQNFIKSRS